MRAATGWIILAALMIALAVMQWLGARALRSWGVSPSRAVMVLRAFNVLTAIGIVIWAFYIWTN